MTADAWLLIRNLLMFQVGAFLLMQRIQVRHLMKTLHDVKILWCFCVYLIVKLKGKKTRKSFEVSWKFNNLPMKMCFCAFDFIWRYHNNFWWELRWRKSMLQYLSTPTPKHINMEEKLKQTSVSLEILTSEVVK